MANKVEFVDNSARFIGKINDATEAALKEAAGEIEAAAKRNSRVDTGKTKGSYTNKISGNTAIIGSPLENAVWEEFGTGEYAIKGGRKGSWVYKDAKGNWYRTRGKKPNRPLQKAFDKVKPKIEKYFTTHFKGVD